MSTSRKRSPFFSISLQWVMILPFVVQIVGAVGLVGYFSYQSGQQTVENLANQLLRQTSARISDRLDSYLQRSQQVVTANKLAVTQGTLNLNNREQLQQQLWQQMLLNPDLPAIQFWSDDGNAIGYYRVSSENVQKLAEKASGKNIPLGTVVLNEIIPNRRRYYSIDSQGKTNQLLLELHHDFRMIPWYKSAKNIGEQSWTPISSALVLPILQSFAFTPIYDPTGKWFGVFTCNYSLSDISVFLNKLRFSRTGQVFIIEQSGDLVATSILAEASVTKQHNGKVERISAATSQDVVTREVSKQLTQKFGSFDNIKESEQVSLIAIGQRQFVQVTHYQDKYGLDWHIVTILPESDFITEIQVNVYRTGLLCILTLIVAVGIGIWASRRIARSLFRLSQVSQDFAKNRLDQPLQTTHIKEVEILAQSFHQMMRELQVAEQTISLIISKI